MMNQEKYNELNQKIEEMFDALTDAHKKMKNHKYILKEIVKALGNEPGTKTLPEEE